MVRRNRGGRFSLTSLPLLETPVPCSSQYRQSSPQGVGNGCACPMQSLSLLEGQGILCNSALHWSMQCSDPVLRELVTFSPVCWDSWIEVVGGTKVKGVNPRKINTDGNVHCHWWIHSSSPSSYPDCVFCCSCFFRACSYCKSRILVSTPHLSAPPFRSISPQVSGQRQCFPVHEPEHCVSRCRCLCFLSDVKPHRRPALAVISSLAIRNPTDQSKPLPTFTIFK